MMTLTLQCCVKLYRRYGSPRKGFKCAYAVEHGRLSCSDWALRVLKRKGAFYFLFWLPRRFRACNCAYVKITEVRQAQHLSLADNTSEENNKERPEPKLESKNSEPVGYAVKYCLTDIACSSCCASILS